MASSIPLLIAVTMAALALNTPFGYLRVRARKFSLLWFFYIHIPIPFIFVLRNMAGLGYWAVPVIVIGAIAGQLIGGRLNPARLTQ